MTDSIAPGDRLRNAVAHYVMQVHDQGYTHENLQELKEAYYEYGRKTVVTNNA